MLQISERVLVSWQGLLLGLGGSELLTKLVGNGPDQRITQPTLYAIANLASKSKAGQDSLNESGAPSISWQILPCCLQTPPLISTDFLLSLQLLCWMIIYL